MIRPSHRSPAFLAHILLAFLAGAIGNALAPAEARARIASPPRGGAPSCAAGVPAPAICDHTLGLALTIPSGWSVAPPGKFQTGVLAFWTLTPGTQEPPLRLIIAALGTAPTCAAAQAAMAAANALVTASRSPRPVLRRSTTLGGAPAVMLAGLPGPPDAGVTYTVAHSGLVYGLTTFGSGGRINGYPIPSGAQREALASLRFIARSGPFPGRRDPLITPALRACAGASVSSTPVRLRIIPRHLRLGESWRVTLTGLQPGTAVTFTASPHGKGGFGGGLMGTYRANDSGAISFVYPAFTDRWEVGTWLTVAQSAAGQTLALAMVTVAPRKGPVQGHAAMPSGIIPAHGGQTPLSPVSTAACPGRTPLALIHSYFAAIARRDTRAARACLTASYRRQEPPDGFGYFGPMKAPSPSA